MPQGISPRYDRNLRWRNEVHRAYLDGLRIESRSRGSHTWLEDRAPSFDWGYYEYRFIDGAGVAHDKVPDIDIIVTRHQSLADFFVNIGFATASTPVIAEVVDWRQITGKHVAGNLPIHLARLTEWYTAVTMNIPSPLRGRELSLGQVMQYAVEVVHYQVDPYKTVKAKAKDITPQRDDALHIDPPNHLEKPR